MRPTIPNFLLALIIVLVLLALPFVALALFGPWGFAAALAAAVIMLGFLRSWFMTEPRAKYLVAALSFFTIGCAAAGVFPLLEIILRWMEGIKNTLCADVGTHWFCRIPEVPFPTTTERWLLFGAIVLSVLAINIILFRGGKRDSSGNTNIVIASEGSVATGGDITNSEVSAGGGKSKDKGAS